MKIHSDLKKNYEEKIKAQLLKELELSSIMAVPNLEKIVVNTGLGKAKDDSSLIDNMLEDLTLILGQKPIVTKSKLAVSNFKIREGQAIGIKATLRGVKMWAFLEKLIHIVLPRVKDFNGISPKAFDGNGNYNLGLKEHLDFPEIDPTKVTRPQGLQITIGTTAKKDEDAKLLLVNLGLPFKK